MASVNHESQNLKNEALRTCKSCRRPLPINFFGILKSKPDMYNPSCIECRRNSRKISYLKGKYKGVIYNLKNNNNKILKELIKSGKVCQLNAVQLQTREILAVKLAFKKNSLQVRIYKDGFNSAPLFDTKFILSGAFTIESILKLISNVFVTFNIRLLDEDSYGFIF